MQISPRCDRMIAAGFRDRGARHVRKAGMLRLASGCGARSVESGKPARRTGFPRMPRGGSTPTAYLKAQSLSSQALTGCQPPDAGKIKFFKKTPISALRAVPVRLHDAFVPALQHLILPVVSFPPLPGLREWFVCAARGRNAHDELRLNLHEVGSRYWP